MSQTILAPFDGSFEAARALPYAAVLAGHGGRVALLGVVPDDHAAAGAAQALHQAAARLRDGPVRDLTVDECLAGGDAASTIVATATALGARAIVLSTHGEGGAARWLYGSTAARVLRHALVPVLLVPATCERVWPAAGPLRALVPLDGSPFAAEAIDAAQALLGERHPQLILVRAAEPLTTLTCRPGCPYMRLSTEQALAEAQRYLDGMAAGLTAADLSVQTRVLSDPPAAAVVAAAREADVHLIVAATHGSTGPSPTIMGRAAAGIVQHAPVPLLLVRPAWIRHTAHGAAPPAAATLAEEVLGATGDRPVSIGLTEDKVDLMLRGLDRLLGEVRPDEPVARLVARLRQAKATYETERRRLPQTEATEATQEVERHRLPHVEMVGTPT